MSTTYSPQMGHFRSQRGRDLPMDRAPAPRWQEGPSAFSPRWDRLSDAALIAYCRAGNRAAWEALLHRHQDYIYRFAWKLCRNREDAEDITARTLLRIYERLDTFRDESSFTAWIMRIAYNLVLDTSLRSRRRVTVSLDQDPGEQDLEISGHEFADPHPTPEQSYFDQLAVENITRAVQHLPAYLRPPMQMQIQGYSYEQMASTLGVSLGTIKSRIFRARSILRERLMQ